MDQGGSTKPVFCILTAAAVLSVLYICVFMEGNVDFQLKQRYTWQVRVKPYTWKLRTQPPPPANVTLHPSPSVPLPAYKFILAWTPFFGHKDYYFGLGHQPFVDHGCEVTNCIFTDDRRKYNESDFILFHGRDMNGLNDMPAHRYPHQIWAWNNMESPYHSAGVFDKVFNFTISYRTDSDMFQAYGGLRPLKPGEKKPDPNIDYSAGKTEMVAWFVSNCHTPGKREKYVAELQKHISVHIYGGCGSHKCPRGSEKTCLNLLKTKYRFYLAFENSLCRDYVTEKLWKLFQHETNVVPVVLGGADYSKFLPKGTYIDVKDFVHPKDLAKFLSDLSKDPARFNKYFAWKQTHTAHEYRPNPICQMCKLVNEKERKKYPIKVHMSSWWNRQKDCQNPAQYFRDKSYL